MGFDSRVYNREVRKRSTLYFAPSRLEKALDHLNAISVNMYAFATATAACMVIAHNTGAVPAPARTD